MRKRRIGYVGALGLALAVAIPASAMAAGTQKVEAGFQPTTTKADAQLDFPVPPFPIPPSSADLGGKDSKHGTQYTRLFLKDFTAPVPEAGVFDIYAPEELTYTTKGLAQCDPATIRGQDAATAKSLCEDALIGAGKSDAFLGQGVPGATGPVLTGGVALFNGTPQNGHPTVLFHATAGTPVTLISEMIPFNQDGFGTLFHTLVAQSAGGAVPDGIPITDTAFTISKDYTDAKLKKQSKKLKKKAKKASGKKAKKLKKKSKKKKQQSKKSWVVGKCTDGELTTKINVSYVSGPAQTDSVTQACT